MTHRRIATLLFLFTAPCLTQTKIDPAARKAIDNGNQAWINGMKQGSATLIALTFADNAVDCPATGDCIKGRPAIEQLMKDRIAKFGRALSASVTSAGSAQQGDFVYEWGRSDATFPNGQKLGGRYLTAWQKQPGGDWKIYRNLRIPDDVAR